MTTMALVPKNKTAHKDKTEQESVESSASTDATDILAQTDTLLDEIDRLLDVETIESLRKTLTELDDVKPYSLADAIREGSMVTDQAIGKWTAQGETCALSAAMLAIRARGLA